MDDYISQEHIVPVTDSTFPKGFLSHHVLGDSQNIWVIFDSSAPTKVVGFWKICCSKVLNFRIWSPISSPSFDVTNCRISSHLQVLFWRHQVAAHLMEGLPQMPFPIVLHLSDEYFLHGFKDACQQGCEACLYLMAGQRANHHSYLLAVKTKVTPIYSLPWVVRDLLSC